MIASTRVAAAWLVIGVFAVSIAGSVYLGYQWADAKWTKKEATRLTAIAQAVGETVARSNALAVEVEKLRARPERVRLVVQKEVEHVVADAQCESFPASYRSLWNAEPDDSEAAGAARVGDEALRALASTSR